MSALSRAEHPVWEDGGRLVPADTLTNTSTARPTYRRLHHIPEMSHPDSEVACCSRTALFISLPAGVTVPRTSCRSLASARPVRHSSCSQICPLSFPFCSPRGRLIPLDILTKRATSFQVGRGRDASVSAALLVVTVQSVVLPQFLSLSFSTPFFCLRNPQTAEHLSFSSHRFTV